MAAYKTQGAVYDKDEFVGVITLLDIQRALHEKSFLLVICQVMIVSLDECRS